MDQQKLDQQWMHRALALAARGEGAVEPNPMVGCVIARGDQMLAEGWHQRFGGPHAEIEALRQAPRELAGATLYVTLEPCSHHGKTPPCAAAIIAAGVGRVVAATGDPFAAVNGRGFQQLRDANIAVEVGCCQPQAEQLLAPFSKLQTTGRPWILAKWAMTLDGKIATAAGSSQWITNPKSRAIVHRIRGRVDGILVGRGTAGADDPQLTARPPGPRTPLRIVLDSQAALPLTSKLVQTAKETPVLIAVGPSAAADRIAPLQEQGCEVWIDPSPDPQIRLAHLLDELGQRRLTNLLVEGGGMVLGSLLSLGQIDEVHAFIAPKLVGGANAPSPLGGPGISLMENALRLSEPILERIDDDIYLHGRLVRS